MDSKVKLQIISELNKITDSFAGYLNFMRTAPGALYDHKNLDIWYDTIISEMNPGNSYLFQHSPKLYSAIEELAIQMFSVRSNLFEVENIIMDPDVGEAFKFRGFGSFDSSCVLGCFNDVCSELQNFTQSINRDLYKDNNSFVTIQDVSEAIYLHDLGCFYSFASSEATLDLLPSQSIFSSRWVYYNMKNDDTMYLTRDSNNRLLLKEGEDILNPDAYICVKDMKYVERFKGVNSSNAKQNGFSYCDSSTLTDWHFGKENNNVNVNESNDKKTRSDKKIDSMIDDIFGNEKPKKKKEKIDRDYKGVFSKLLFIIKFPFIKIGGFFALVFKGIKSLFTKFGKWFKGLFVLNHEKIYDKNKNKEKNKKLKKDKKWEVKREKENNKVKVKKERVKKERREFKLFKIKFPKIKLPNLGLNINPYIISFLLPILICFIVWLGYDLKWFNTEFFQNLNSNIHFVDGFGSVIKGVQDWLAPNLEEVGTIPGLLAFILVIPLSFIAFILESIWWLISWVVIGFIKLLIFLVGNIIFILPALLYILGIVLDIIFFSKYDEKDVSVVIGFVISLLACITFGILIFV